MSDDYKADGPLAEPEFLKDDGEGVVAMCSDCLTVLPDSVAAKDRFLQAGKYGVCKYCGGVLVVLSPSQVENARKKRRSGEMLH